VPSLKYKQFFTGLLLGLVLVLAAMYFGSRQPRWGFRSLDAPTILLRVKQLKQLVTVRYSIQRVVGITEPRVPLGSESILIMVQGEALAGVDLETIAPQDVRITGRHSVTINLPQATLIDTFLDEKHIKVWDHQITWWTPWVEVDPDLEHRARLQALDEVRKAALNMGILDQAQSSAENTIREFLSAINIQVRFERPGS
jgi:Protein of unknown function (DUF4230)